MTRSRSGVLVEAIAAGMPVVATAFPHAEESLETGPGIVVAHGGSDRDRGRQSGSILTEQGLADRMRSGGVGRHCRDDLGRRSPSVPGSTRDTCSRWPYDPAHAGGPRRRRSAGLPHRATATSSA